MITRKKSAAKSSVKATVDAAKKTPVEKLPEPLTVRSLRESRPVSKRQIGVRFSEPEFQDLLAAARTDGQTSISNYVRLKCGFDIIR